MQDNPNATNQFVLVRNRNTEDDWRPFRLSAVEDAYQSHLEQAKYDTIAERLAANLPLEPDVKEDRKRGLYRTTQELTSIPV